MKKFIIAAMVVIIMVIGILGITNPAFKQTYSLFGNAEGNLTHNYFIFSIYRQQYSDIKTKEGKFKVYRRFIGIAMNFYEISPQRVENK
jgi:hypothetical protein